jgi:hypothetical protein
LRPLTAREKMVADFFRRPTVAGGCMVIAAATLGLLACGLGQAYCNQPTGPVQNPDGASYCAKMAQPNSWAAYTAAAVALALAVRWIVPRRYARRIALLVVVLTVVVATGWLFTLPIRPG